MENIRHNPKDGSGGQLGSGVFAKSVRKALNISFVVLMMIALLFNVFWAFRNDELRDFGSFVASGRAISAGRNPYGFNEPLVYHVVIQDAGIDVSCPNLNPPVSIPIFAQLTFSDPYLALKIWRIFSMILYLISITLLVRMNDRESSILKVLLALSLAGWWHNLELGQIYAVLVMLVTGAWLLFRRQRFILAGILIGLLVAIKPQFAVWPLFLLVLGYWPAVVASLICFVGLWLWPAILYGPRIYIQWLVASSQYSGIDLLNFSFPGLTIRFGSASSGMALGLLLIVILLLWVWRTQPDFSHASSLALIAALLTSPITWSGYLLVLLPIFFERGWSAWMKVVLVILLIPVPVLLSFFTTSKINFVIWGWMYGWALLLLLFQEVRSIRTAPNLRLGMR